MTAHTEVPLLLIAASGLAREIAAMLASDGSRTVIGMLDDDTAAWGTDRGGVRVLGAIDSVVDYPQAELLLCAGRGTARSAIAKRLDELGVDSNRYTTVVHRSVDVPPGCIIGSGSIVLAQVAITAHVRIGRHVVVMPNATLTHDDVLEDYSTICAGVALGGDVTVGEYAYLGMNASVRQGLTVGSGSTLGMGAVLLQSLPTGETWAGVPASAVRGS